MLHHPRQRQRERLGDAADRQSILVCQPGENGPPCRVRERSEGQVQLGVLIVNHLVKYKDALLRRQPGMGDRRSMASESALGAGICALQALTPFGFAL
jgi:hypothetical protein